MPPYETAFRLFNSKLGRTENVRNIVSTYEMLTLLVSLIAVVIAFVSLYRTHRVVKRQIELAEGQAELTKLQHKLLAQSEDEKRKADVRVCLVKVGGNYRLVFENRGPARAKDIVVEEFVPDGFKSPFMKSEMDKFLPIPQLLPGEEISMLTAVNLSTPPQFSAKVSWLDGREERQDQFCQLSLGSAT